VANLYNVTIDQGSDWYLTVTYKNPNGTPINLTGYTAALQLRSLPESPSAVLSLSTGSGITITGATGVVDIHATATQTRAIDEGTYYYDLEITSPATIVTRLIQGQAVVSPEVTR
jgi:hypothetical protein